MSTPSLPALDNLPAPLVRLVEKACTQFEEEWAAGRRPRLEDFLGQAPAEAREVLLVELLRVEMAYRRRAGETAAAADYQARLPQDAALIEALFDASNPVMDRTRSGVELVGLTRYAAPSLTTLPFNGNGTAAPSPHGEVPGYEILEVVGQGGMGIVYRARQTRANRVVALKRILARAHATLEQKVRFQIEAEAVAHLAHPNIVALYEVGEHDGSPFFTLEFCDGSSLDRKLKAGPLPAAEAAALVEQLAQAVAYAHGRGVIHRDLKPANVLLTADGVPKVTDFGLAKRLDAGSNLSATGEVLGTPSYMAPEQAVGKGADIGPAADVYALGAILYECLTGRPPFRALTALETLMLVQTDEPIAPARLNPKVPRDLETICLKCLEKEPGKRYSGAAALAEDLRRYRAGEPVAARPVGALGRAIRWARRRPAAAALAAVSVLGAVGVLATVLAYNGRLRAQAAEVARQRDAAEDYARLEAQARQEAHAARDTAEAALRESQQRLALNYFAYGRLCALAARLATTDDETKREETRREFRTLREALGRLGDPAIQPALAAYNAALEQWGYTGHPPEALRRCSLALARACHKPWTDLMDRECPDLANQVRGLLYARVVGAADEMTRAARPEDASRAMTDFWELYWGELVMLENQEVERVMVRLGHALSGWRQGPPPAELARQAAELRRACRLPPSGAHRRDGSR